MVIEEFLEGDEISFLCLSDGKHVVPLVPAQDHKRMGEGDTGPTRAAWASTPRTRCSNPA